MNQDMRDAQEERVKEYAKVLEVEKMQISRKVDMYKRDLDEKSAEVNSLRKKMSDEETRLGQQLIDLTGQVSTLSADKRDLEEKLERLRVELDEKTKNDVVAGTSLLPSDSLIVPPPHSSWPPSLFALCSFSPPHSQGRACLH